MFNKLLAVLFSAILLLPLGNVVLADSGVSSNTGFTVKKVPSQLESQKARGLSYFNIDMTRIKGQEIKLSYELENRSNQEITVEAFPRDAHPEAKRGSAVTYNQDAKETVIRIIDNDYKMTDYINNFPMEITLGPNERKVVSVNLTTPEVEGEVLGAVAFYSKEDDTVKEDKEENGTSMKIITRNEVVSSIYLTSDFGMLVPYTFDKARTEMNVENLTVNFDVTNPNAALHTQVVSYQVLDSDKNILMEGEQPKVKMPPKSAFVYAFSWDESVPSEVGNYTLVVNGTELSFSIDKDMAKEIKKRERSNQPAVEGFSLLDVILIVVGVLLLVALFWIIAAKRRKGKEEEKNQEETSTEEE